MKKLIKSLDDLVDKYNLDQLTDFEWKQIPHNERLSMKFIEQYKDQLDWNFVSSFQKLSEKVIEKYIDYVNWHYISSHQRLSQSFIEKYADKVDWVWISAQQKMSIEFIYNHMDEISIPHLFVNKHLDKDKLKELGLDIYLHMKR